MILGGIQHTGDISIKHACAIYSPKKQAEASGRCRDTVIYYTWWYKQLFYIQFLVQFAGIFNEKL